MFLLPVSSLCLVHSLYTTSSTKLPSLAPNTKAHFKLRNKTNQLFYDLNPPLIPISALTIPFYTHHATLPLFPFNTMIPHTISRHYFHFLE